MPYEYPTGRDALRQHKTGCQQAFEFNDSRHGRWGSRNNSVLAVVRGLIGSEAWDRARLFVSEGLVRRRLIGENR
jgi:hypothetical protein